MKKKNKYVIGIDARIFTTATGGIGRYTRELINGLEEVLSKSKLSLDELGTPSGQNPNYKDLEFIIFLNKEGFDEYEPKNPNFRKVLVNVGWYGFAEQLLTLPKWFGARCDLMHFTHFNKSILYRKRYVVTIHDLTYSMQKKLKISKLPPVIFEIKHAVYEQAIKDTIKRAKTVIVPTQYSKDDIVKKYHIKPERVAVTYESVDKGMVDLGDEETCEKLKKRFGIKYPYFLRIGNALPHKNLPRLVVAFSEFVKNQPEAQLVLIGKKDKFYDRLEKLIAEKGVQGKVIVTGMLDDHEYQSLLKGARAMAFPSLAEGFGIPPLEAMGAGVPVVMSDASCLPEMGSDAALYFDPLDEHDMAQKLEQIFTDADLRKKLIEKGKKRVDEFSWEKMAEETLEVYKKALGIK